MKIFNSDFQTVVKPSAEDLRQILFVSVRMMDHVAVNEMADLLSDSILAFAKSIRAFSNLPPIKQMAVIENSSSLLVLTLAVVPPVALNLQSITDGSSLAKLFPIFQTKNRKRLLELKTRFDHWQPSMDEITCLMAMMLCKGVFSRVEQGYKSFVAQILSITRFNVSFHRARTLGQIFDHMAGYIFT